MKILHLISGGDTGGAKTHILSLFQGFKGKIDAKIICFIKDSFYDECKENGIDIEVFEQKKRYDLSVVGELASEIEKENYDIIHCHGARANFIAFFLRFKVSKPFITTVHSDYKLDFKDNLYKRLVFTALNTFALKRFKNFIAVSDTFREMLIDRGFKSDRIYTIYNGIDLNQKIDYDSKTDFYKKYGILNPENKTVGIIARLDQVKDHRTFIRGAKLVLDKMPDVNFIIAGDGPEKKMLEDLCGELDIEDNVYFIGHIQDVYSFYNAIDINTLTSLSESFPYAILEGAYMKKPIVSTRVGGLKKLIKNGENGYLVDVGDYEELSNRLLELLEDDEKMKNMGESLYEEVEKNYSSEKMAEEHIKIYEIIKEKEATSHEI